MKIVIALVVILFSTQLYAQNLSKERIWKLSSRKKSIFLDKGIFHVKTGQGISNVVGVRNSYVKSRGYERIVFDFNSNQIPSVYGHISQESHKVYLDFFNTKLARTIESMKGTKFVNNLDFFGIDGSSLSVELSFNKSSTFDIFYLENPGRLVIDIKK